jgi:phosphoribosylglycinamide formyltransferase 1
MDLNNTKKIVIFASGSGSNAENIATYFKDNELISTELIISNKENAGVLDRAKKLGIKSVTFKKHEFEINEKVDKILTEINPDLVILAGFLLKFPGFLVRKFNNKVLNIHPALLPKFGGKGMYGMNVHKAVHENKEQKTGITIHYVNENYDEGAIIKQFECSLNNSDTPDSIAKKISKLEMENFPRVIEETLLK